MSNSNNTEKNVFERLFKLWTMVCKLVLDGKRRPETVADALQKIVDEPEHIIDCSAPVFIPGCWSVLPDNEQLPSRITGQFKWDASKVALYLGEDQKNGPIDGNSLRDALKTEKVLPAQVLDYLLEPENQHLIPEEWKVKDIFFWGTIYRRRDGDLCVRYLYRNGDEWSWDYRWLEHGWGDSSPAACAQD